MDKIKEFLFYFVFIIGAFLVLSSAKYFLVNLYNFLKVSSVQNLWQYDSLVDLLGSACAFFGLTWLYLAWIAFVTE